ncbi:hypothetical protein TWF569_003145 [Orbilia oligospora]|uniref:FAD dependent oxidoreductase domain-containing protein n=1 Tax=Orbilia oligospora TaxID=2813651 RepID=A0A7C8J635_ORBOL|nr:hypothetical protein TWF103_001653 [Orbilia oligospora]KAF3097027.1 hypothetical protein TWF102_006468 [Orbilia oligospora]KAF3110189.1 hypothetical protein TWF706_000918 [Orbilia oligospora]KAF3120468.1 hypothetical protein TWF569_003145 [Orbilia oligospora]KAF3122930.1 hypothetical protein TWF703_001076 [Orbilia oligospora]
MPQNTTNDNTTTNPHSSSTNPADSSIIILGAGIIGLSTAYYLSSSSSPSLFHNHHKVSPQNITLLDTSPTLFACASGRAGGFLAKDWFGAASSKLGELSFGLHRQLADANDGRRRWGYSPSNSYSFERGTGEEGRKRGDDWLRDGTSRVDASSGVGGEDDGNVQRGTAPAWWNCEGGKVELSCTGDSTAQLDPLGLCEFLLEEVRRRGVTIRHPVTPVRVVQSPDKRLEGLVISNGNGTAEEEQQEEVLSCSHILIAAGSWSGRLFEKLFPTSGYRLPISSLAGHSIVVRSPAHRSQETEPRDLHAVFSSIDGLDWHPEAFSRVNGDIYLAGINSATIPLPELATDVKENDADIQMLISSAKDLIVQFGVGGDKNDDHDDSTRNGLTNEANVIRRGLCHRPVTPAGKPILSRIPDAFLGGLNTNIGGGGGVFVATGHGPWGISMSLGTGKVMAEMILGGETTVEVSQLGLQ